MTTEAITQSPIDAASVLSQRVSDAEQTAMRIFVEMVDRARNVARFDVENDIRHSPIVLFGVTGAPVLEAAIGKVYEAAQEQIRAERNGARS